MKSGRIAKNNIGEGKKYICVNDEYACAFVCVSFSLILLYFYIVLDSLTTLLLVVISNG